MPCRLSTRRSAQLQPAARRRPRALTLVVSLTGRSSSPYARTTAAGPPSQVATSRTLGMVADTATKRTDATGACRAGARACVSRWRMLFGGAHASCARATHSAAAAARAAPPPSPAAPRAS